MAILIQCTIFIPNGRMHYLKKIYTYIGLFFSVFACLSLSSPKKNCADCRHLKKKIELAKDNYLNGKYHYPAEHSYKHYKKGEGTSEGCSTNKVIALIIEKSQIKPADSTDKCSYRVESNTINKWIDWYNKTCKRKIDTVSANPF